MFGETVPPFAIQGKMWHGWWIHPETLHIYNPRDPGYELELMDFVDARRALFLMVQIAKRYACRDDQAFLGAGFAWLLHDVLSIQNTVCQQDLPIPTRGEIQAKLRNQP